MAKRVTKGRRIERDSTPPTTEKPLAVAVLGAGAPHSPLMAGALAYMYQHNKTFDIFYTSGGGALMGLLFVAPGQGKPPDEALRDVVEFGVDDRIYKAFPVGYKTFFKRGWFTEQLHGLAEVLKADVTPRPFPGQADPPGYDPKGERRKRLYNDAIDFWASTLTPPRLGPTSLGLCEALPFLEKMVDFPGVNSKLAPSGLDFKIPILLPGGVVGFLRPGWFYVNAYNLKTKTMDQFSNRIPVDFPSAHAGPLTADSVRAALSFPFIYPPQEIDGAPYCEGALVDPLNLPDATPVIVRTADTNSRPRPPKVREMRFYLFDILGALEQQLMYCPRNLWEGYGLSILTPVISLATKSRKIFECNPALPRLIPVSFDIPRESRDRPLEWSYGNMTRLWDAGWKAGEKLLHDWGPDLPNRVRA